jgi:hypothetical protein
MKVASRDAQIMLEGRGKIQLLKPALFLPLIIRLSAEIYSTGIS